MAWEYSDKTKQLFMDAIHGKPGTHLGEVENPDGVGVHGSIACGDALHFSFRVRRNEEDPAKDVIVEAKYLTFGCTSAIAASEALCHLVEDGELTPIEALQIKNGDIVRFLEGLPKQKIHCSVMGEEALTAAVFDWAQKRGVDLKKLGHDLHEDEMEEGRIVCQCFSLGEPYIRRKIKELNLRTISDISDAIKAGGACTTCHHTPGGLQDLLDEEWGQNSRKLKIVPKVAKVEGSDQGTPASPYQFSKRVEKVIEECVKPILKRDGGAVEIIDIKDKLVYCHLTGACKKCIYAGVTTEEVVEKTLRDMVDEEIKVIRV